MSLNVRSKQTKLYVYSIQAFCHALHEFVNISSITISFIGFAPAAKYTKLNTK